MQLICSIVSSGETNTMQMEEFRKWNWDLILAPLKVNVMNEEISWSSVYVVFPQDIPADPE
jgi:hypothetical protein